MIRAALLLVVVVCVYGCALSHDDEAGVPTSGDAGVARRDAGNPTRDPHPPTDPGPIETQICECCGAEVEWPRDISCDLGACDEYCLWVDPPPDTTVCDCCGTEQSFPYGSHCEIACEPFCDAEACEPMDVRYAPCRGVECGDVAPLYYWDGHACRPLDECYCEGDGCGAMYSTQSACVRAHARCDSQLCRNTGGQWLSHPLYCGHSHCGTQLSETCDDGAPACDCPLGSEFVPSRGCIVDPSCSGVCPPFQTPDDDGTCSPDTASLQERCESTGGHLTPCGNSECGRLSNDDCDEPGCHCGAHEIFDPDYGCRPSESCNLRDAGDRCGPTLPCGDGLLCSNERCVLPACATV